MENIHPIFDKILDKKAKESLLNQKATVYWFTGLSGSGKSTIAEAFEKKLHSKGYYTMLLDGDNMRTGLCNNLDFSEEGRQENIRRIAEVSKLFLNAGAITICSFVSPTIDIRRMAAELIGKDFIEVFVNTPLEVCEQRDVKGLYAKARSGEIKNFTGIDAPFESPENPSLVLNTVENSVDQLVDICLSHYSNY